MNNINFTPQKLFDRINIGMLSCIQYTQEGGLSDMTNLDNELFHQRHCCKPNVDIQPSLFLFADCLLNIKLNTRKSRYKSIG